MNTEQRGLTLRSNPETYALGSGFTFKTDFMAQARQMSAPEVHSITVVFTGTVGGITGGALGRDAAKVFDSIRFKDADEVLNASGAGLRVLEQMESGSKQVDPSDVASGATNASYIYRLKIWFAPYWRALRPRDFAIPVAHFLEGGEFTVQTPAALPTGWNSVQSDWRVRLFAHVIDGRVPELKSRRRIKEEALTQQEFDYQINGFLRAAIITSKLTTTGYTDLSGFTTLFSRTLKLPPAYQTHMLQNEYRQSATAVSTTDEFLLAANGAVALHVPLEDQKIGKMIDTRTLHLDLLAAAPTSGRLLTDTVIDRSGELASLVAGYPSAGELAMAIRKGGQVVGEGGNYPANGFNAQLARKLPIRVHK